MSKKKNKKNKGKEKKSKREGSIWFKVVPLKDTTPKDMDYISEWS